MLNIAGKQGGITADASRTVTGLDPISTITVHVDDSLVGAVVGAKVRNCLLKSCCLDSLCLLRVFLSYI